MQREHGEGLPPRIADVPEIASSIGSPLPPALRDRTTDVFGADLGGVRLHTDAPAARAAARMGANAFTAGEDIFFAAGAFHPPGNRLLGHELAHVLQQRAGASIQDKASELRLERNADVAASAFEGGGVAPAAISSAQGGHSEHVQRQVAGPDQKTEREKDPEKKSWTGAAADCGVDYCRPFGTRLAAQAQRDLYWPFIKAGIALNVTASVLPIWDVWAYGGSSLQNFNGRFGKDFETSGTTADATTFLVEALKAELTANPPVVAPGGAIARTISQVIPDAIASIDKPVHADRMNFDEFTTAPGNLAGDIGKDESANPVGSKPSTYDDARIAQGFVIITDEGGSTLKVSPSITYTVIDTIDLCPGYCGSEEGNERIATIPMSRWEATGISGDVPFTVSFPAATTPFTIPKPTK